MDSTACRPGVLQDCGTDITERRRDDSPEVLRKARFEKAWSQNVAELRRRSLYWTGGRWEDADDAIGQAALVALEKMPHDLQADEARRWLLRLVYNKCMDIHRQHGSRFVEQEKDSADEEIEAVGPGIEAMLLEGELLAIIQDRIQRLPSRLKSVAELHLLREKPYSQIADLLSISEVNVRKRMQQARTLLREHLQPYRQGDVRFQAPKTLDADRGSVKINQSEPLRTSGWGLEALKKYVQRHPRGWKKRWELALRLREAGALEKAILHFDEAARRQPRRMELWLDLGATLLLVGCSQEARDVLEAALRRARDERSRARLLELIARC